MAAILAILGIAGLSIALLEIDRQRRFGTACNHTRQRTVHREGYFATSCDQCGLLLATVTESELEGREP